MLSRLLSLVFVLGAMGLVVHLDLFMVSGVLSPTLVLGFLLLSAYCVGVVLESFGLPLITGYILSGLLFGPYFLHFYDLQTIFDLSFINSMALAYIAFCAGGELKLSSIKKNLKSIVFLLVGSSLVVFVGVTLTVFFLSSMLPFTVGYSVWGRLAIASIFGIITIARSPASTIAIINETKAHGRYTDLILSVTIAKDVVIIVLFAVVVSVCGVLLYPEKAFDFVFIFSLLAEIVIAFVLGFFLGKAIIYLIERVGVEFPVVIVGMGFFVIKFSHLLGAYVEQMYNMSLNLEPLLICMAAGYTVQNFSQHGKQFLARLNRVSMPIYVAFFSVTGASIRIDILKNSWMLGLIVVLIRTVMLYVGCFFSSKIAGDEPKIYRNAWLGFITQAGVSLGLLAEVVRRFPEFGVSIQSVLIATISANQIIGPIGFKHALRKVGEIRKRARNVGAVE